MSSNHFPLRKELNYAEISIFDPPIRGSLEGPTDLDKTGHFKGNKAS